MENMSYLSPEVEVWEVAVEAGFENSTFIEVPPFEEEEWN